MTRAGAIVLLLMFAAASASAAATNAPVAKAPALIQLPDQFNVTQTLRFPSTNVTLLAIADRKGSDQLEDWIAPLYKRYGQRIAIHGLADVSSVPPGLQGVVRNAFQKALSHPVMLDWSGGPVREITYERGKANILLIAPDGRIIRRITGGATRSRLNEMMQLIDRALAEPPKNERVERQAADNAPRSVRRLAGSL